MGKPSRPDRRRRATAVVEAAVLLPFCLLAAIAAVDYCRIFQREAILAHAAHAGALAGASHGFSPATRSAWEARIRDAVRSAASELDDDQQGALQVDVSTVDEPEEYFLVTVEVACPFRPMLLTQFVPAETMIRRSQTMRRFR